MCKFLLSSLRIDIVNFYVYPDSGEISTTECVQELCTIAQTIPDEGGWHCFALPVPQIGINTAPETEWKAEDRYDNKFCFFLIKSYNLVKTLISATNCGQMEI
jgi:hypothetical protein